MVGYYTSIATDLCKFDVGSTTVTYFFFWLKSVRIHLVGRGEFGQVLFITLYEDGVRAGWIRTYELFLKSFYNDTQTTSSLPLTTVCTFQA